jgi:Ca2+-binding EF-hand superfamily protein
MVTKYTWFAAVALVAVPALSGQEENWHERFRGLDRNGDGTVSRSEFPGARRVFARYDWNRDGMISGDELLDPNASRVRNRGTSDRVERFENLDRNRDSRVQSYEWPYNRPVFRQLDRNRDSTLTLDEFNALEGITLKQLDRDGNNRIDSAEWPFAFAKFQELDRDNNGRLTSEEYFQRGTEWDRSQRMRSWDANRNGRIESHEWKSSRRLFHLMDRNFDSVITEDEFQDQGRDMFLKDMDRNGDNVLTRSEWRGSAAGFRELDANNDGRIDAQEFFFRDDYSGRQQRFHAADRNRNGYIEGNEWRGNRDLFHSLDTNSDSRLDANEFMAANPETGFYESDRYSYFPNRLR